jgi:hypothetical protein
MTLRRTCLTDAVALDRDDDLTPDHGPRAGTYGLPREAFPKRAPEWLAPALGAVQPRAGVRGLLGMEHTDDPANQVGPRTALPDAGTGQVVYVGSDVHRRIAAKGSGGIPATVVITVRQGAIWVSIDSPFAWEVIMEPAKVDELMMTLGAARDDARRMGTRKVSRGPGGSRAGR